MQMVSIAKMYINKVFGIRHYLNNLLIHTFSLAVSMLINDIFIEILTIHYYLIFMSLYYWNILNNYSLNLFLQYASLL